MDEPLFIGVDGGGTKCRARIRDAAGRNLGEGVAGAANARLRQAAFGEVMKACRAAATVAGLAEADLGRLHAGLGLAGTQQTGDRDFVLSQPNPFASLALDTDAYAAWLGAFGGRDGAILIVGTGSCGLAVVGGRRINVGGWGDAVSDEGSGMAIGRTAVRRALWALEGMAPMTPLADAVLNRFNRDPPTIVEWAARATPGDFAALSPVVFDYASRNDIVAMAILGEAADDVSRLILRLLEVGAGSIAMIGGVFPHILPWLPPPLRAVCVQPAADAADGAILLARRAFKPKG